jgi:hypothetical protein
MEIFNFFKKKNIADKKPNINNDIIENMNSICKVSHEKRDHTWTQKFIKSLSYSSLKIDNPKIITDSYGREYYNLTQATDTDNGILIKDFITQNIENGLGIAINGNKETSDWIFSYGDILDFHLHREFYSDEIINPFTGLVKDTIIGNNRLRIGQPSETFFPENARKIVREFLESFGIDPKICLIIWIDEGNELTLTFNIVPQMFEKIDSEQFESLLHHLKWYFPRHYKIASMIENENFEPL